MHGGHEAIIMHGGHETIMWGRGTRSIMRGGHKTIIIHGGHDHRVRDSIRDGVFVLGNRHSCE